MGKQKQSPREHFLSHMNNIERLKAIAVTIKTLKSKESV